MTKYPLLEQLRADRERLEEEITAPLRWELIRAGAAITNLRETITRLEGLLRAPIMKHVSEEIGHMLGEAVQRAIIEGARKSRPGDSWITVNVPREIMNALGDHTSLERAVVDEYRKALPHLRIRAVSDMRGDEKVTMLQVSLPELHVRRLVA